MSESFPMHNVPHDEMPMALWRLHEAVFQLFDAFFQLSASLDAYPIDYGSERFCAWLESNRFEDWPTDPYHSVIADRAREALQRSLACADLAASIRQHKQLFFWFAEAYVNWPSERGLVGAKTLVAMKKPSRPQIAG